MGLTMACRWSARLQQVIVLTPEQWLAQRAAQVPRLAGDGNDAFVSNGLALPV